MNTYRRFLKSVYICQPVNKSVNDNNKYVTTDKPSDIGFHYYKQSNNTLTRSHKMTVESSLRIFCALVAAIKIGRLSWSHMIA